MGDKNIGESWLENEISGKKSDDFLKSSTLPNQSIGGNRPPPPPPPGVKPKPPPPAPVKKELPTIIETPKSKAVVVEEEFEDELDIDRGKPTPKSVATSDFQDQNEAKTKEFTKDPNEAMKKEFDVKISQRVDPNAKLKKTIFNLNLAATILGAVCSLILLIFIILAYKSFSGQHFPFDALKESWGKEVIWDITTKIPSSPTCQSNYTPSISFPWPGANAGCDCRNSTSKTYSNQGLIPQVCTSDMNTTGCIQSNATAATEVKSWKDVDMFCEQRMKGVSMDTMVLNSVTSDYTCKPGYKMCPPPPEDGSISTQSTGNRMCVPTWMARCPITDIAIGNCNTNPDPNCYSTASSDVIKLNQNGDCLFKSYTCGKGPISYLAIAEDSPCRLLNQTQIARNHTDHPFLRSKRSRCDPNENAALKDSILQTSFLSYFGVPYQNISGYANNIANFTYGLFAVNYQRWAWNHREETDLKLIFNNKGKIEQILSYHMNSIIFFSISLFFFGLLFPALFYFEAIRPDLYRQNRILLCTKYLVMWFFKLSALPILLLIMKYNSDVYQRYHLFAQSQFSNPYENARIQALANSMSSGLYKWDVAALWMAVLTIIADIALMFFICKLEDRKMITEDMDLDQTLTDGVELGVKQ